VAGGLSHELSNDLKGLQRNVDLDLFQNKTNLVEYQNRISQINIKILQSS
jgi:hypothetical protein